MKNIEKKVLHHLQERGWDKLRPADIAKSIMIEGAELLEHFQWENLPLEEVKRDVAKLAEIKKELADVMIYCIEMSVLLELKTDKIILDKLAAAAKKYPAALMKANMTREPGTQSEYLRIKKEYRQKNKTYDKRNA